MGWDGWIDAMRCDGFATGAAQVVGRQGRQDAPVHMLTELKPALWGTSSMSHPLTCRAGRAGHDGCWISNWPLWRPVNLTPLRLCSTAAIRRAAAANRMFPT